MNVFSKLLLSGVILFSSVAFSQEEYSSKQIKKYKNGIFEVITLKLEDNTVYKEEFPHKLVPFQVRNDKYYSVGTAFLLKDKTFVSAAHVFNIGQRSLLSENFALRDNKGNLFTITNVEKYSNYRDLIQFTVKESTSSYHKFEIAKAYEEGDIIYAAGNAHGEGVIFRKGTLTSFTYEPIDGKWKDIRFSAAASPGNSGGPLLNINGEVVGIVTRKSSNENLNYAFPIDKFLAFSTEKAEFFESQLGEFESSKSLTYEWNFSASLPKGIMELRKEAEKSLYDRFNTGRDEFVAKYKNDIFPDHPQISKYLKNQSNNDMFAIIDKNGNDEWLLYRPEDKRKIKISNNQSMFFTQSKKMLGSYQFFLEKPESENLAAFINNKKHVLDTFLTSMQWNRQIANTEVFITSYGEPFYEENYEDVYGRPWQMAMWQDTYADRGIILYCLPVPRGVICDFMETSISWLEVQKTGYKTNLHRMMLSYTAKLSEWSSFLELPQSLIPSVFRDAKVAFTDGKVEFKVGEFSGAMQDMKLTEESNLYVAIEIDPIKVNELVVHYFNLMPNLNEDGKFSVSKLYDLGEDASDGYNDFWSKFTQNQSPYNFEVLNEGKVISKKVNLGVKKENYNHNKNKAIDGVGYLAVCTLQSELDIEELEKTCEAFINGLN